MGVGVHKLQLLQRQLRRDSRSIVCVQDSARKPRQVRVADKRHPFTRTCGRC